MTTISTDIWERSRVISTLSSAEFRSQLSQLVRDLIESKNFKKRFVTWQLPKDLKDFCVDNNYPSEVLNFTVELQKGSSKEGGPITEVAKKLIDFWIESNFCAEAFLRFSLHQFSSSETENFNRVLFSIADTFHLSRREFPRFIFDQVLLVISVITQSVQRGEENEIQTGYFSSVITKVFLRFHSDSENFYTHFDSEGELVVEIRDSFLQFIILAGEQCRENFIARRLFGKILLGLGQNAVTKIAKTIFLVDTYSKFDTTISKLLLFPPEEFLHKNPTWRHFLFTSLSLKTRIENFDFFTSWGNFVWTESIELLSSSGLSDVDNIWKICCDNWSLIIHNACADQKTVVSSTHSIVSLLKCIKDSPTSNSKAQDQLALLFGSVTSEISKILQCISKCLDSTDSNKQACGMAVGQIVCDLLEVHRKISPSSPSPNLDIPSTGDGNMKLKFESTHLLFLKFVNFYEGKMIGELTKPTATTPLGKSKLVPRNFLGKFEFLDSDDEVDEDDDMEEISQEKDQENESCQFKPYDMSNDTPVDESLYNLKGLGHKIPIYFSDICEVLLEAHGSKDEAIMEKLKQIAILRVPLLLFNKVKIDSSTAQKLARMLAEIETGGLLEIPIICGLFELASAHPIQVFQAIALVAFDKDHLGIGHRMTVLSRYSEIIHLLSKQKCFSCFSEETGKLDKMLSDIHQPFMKDYMEKRRLVRKCQLCFKAEKKLEGTESTSVSKHLDSGPMNTVTSTSSSSTLISDKDLSWRQIVDERVASKTRRFASSRVGKTVETPDTYSSTLVPICWSSLANRLMSNTILLRDSEATNKTSMAVFAAHALRILGWIVFGTSGIYCPHLRNIATQSVDLVKMFYNHDDPHVRRSVISLLSIIITSAEGKAFVLEIFTSQDNLFEQIKPVFQSDPDPDNRFLFNNLMKFVAAAAVEMGNFLT